MSSKNPHCICTWEDEESCEDCKLKGRLHCHLDKKYAIIFGIPFFVGFTPAFVGLILLRYPLNLISTLVWIGYIIFFFLIWEPPILCAHCPYYAEGEAKFLHCSINYGFYKTAKFKPGPATLWERIQFLVGANIIFAIPLVFLVFGENWTKHKPSPQELGVIDPINKQELSRPNPYIAVGPYQMPFGSEVNWTLLVAVNGLSKENNLFKFDIASLYV